MNSILALLQFPLSALTAVINLYCLITLLAVPELHKLEFYFVGLQSLADVLVSGLCASLYNYAIVSHSFFTFCDNIYGYSYEIKIMDDESRYFSDGNFFFQVPRSN